MNPKAYQSYLKALKSGDKRDFDRSLLNTDDKNMCMFTIKNYQQPTGLSTRFFSSKYPGEEFEVMGPMGKGLSVQSEGIHIAFAGGTGTLTFVDLVAHLILENLGLITTQDNSILTNGSSFVTTESMIGDQKNFKFILYASFQERADSVALELLEAFQIFCDMHNFKNFELVLRLSKEKLNPARWDAKFINKEIDKHNNNLIRRIWVCGPPVLNETFEKVFNDRIAAGKTLSNGTYEVL